MDNRRWKMGNGEQILFNYNGFFILHCVSFILCLLPSALCQACSPDSLAIINANLTIAPSTTFDPFTATDMRHTFTIDIKNNSAIDCNGISLKFSDTVAPNQLISNNGDGIRFQIVPVVANYSLINNPTGMAIGNINALAIERVQLELIIPTVSIVPAPGEYLNTTTKLILANAEYVTMDSSKTLRVKVTVDNVLNINIGGSEYVVGTLAPYAMNFGNLKNGVMRDVNVTTWANCRHSIRIESEHYGALVGPLPASTHKIDYVMSFDGVELNFNHEVVIQLGEKTALKGTMRMLRATITDVNAARAGVYRDVVTLIVVSEF